MFIEFPTLSVLPTHARSQKLISQPPLQLNAGMWFKALPNTFVHLALHWRMSRKQAYSIGMVITALTSRGQQWWSLKQLNLSLVWASLVRVLRQASAKTGLKEQGFYRGKCLSLWGKTVKGPPKAGRAIKPRGKLDPEKRREKQRLGATQPRGGLAKPEGSLPAQICCHGSSSSPRNGPALAFLLPSITAWEPPREEWPRC